MAGCRLRRSSRRWGFTALEFSGVIAVVAIFVCLIVSWGLHARERAQETSCMSNLKQIGMAMHLYAADYDNHLPPGDDAIAALASIYTKNQQLYVCPADENPAVIGAKAPEEAAGPPSGTLYGGRLPTQMECSYFIVPGLMNDDPPAELIAGDTVPRHRGRWNAICLDGRVESRPASEWPVYWPSGSER